MSSIWIGLRWLQFFTQTDCSVYIKTAKVERFSHLYDSTAYLGEFHENVPVQGSLQWHFHPQAEKCSALWENPRPLPPETMGRIELTSHSRLSPQGRQIQLCPWAAAARAFYADPWVLFKGLSEHQYQNDLQVHITFFFTQYLKGFLYNNH